jgi:phage/plasmid-associated DNA primase
MDISLNYCDDIGDEKDLQNSKMKQLLTAKYYSFRRLQCQSVHKRNITKHWLAGNNLPYMRNLDLAFCRRWLVFICDQEIPEEGRIDRYEELLLSDEDFVEGFLHDTITYYKLLKENRQFMQSKEEIYSWWAGQTDYVFKFLNECCERTTNSADYITQATTYDYFSKYCVQNAFLVVSQVMFTKKLSEFGYQVKQFREHGEDIRWWAYDGLSVKKEFIEKIGRIEEAERPVVSKSQITPSIAENTQTAADVMRSKQIDFEGFEDFKE